MGRAFEVKDIIKVIILKLSVVILGEARLRPRGWLLLYEITNVLVTGLVALLIKGRPLAAIPFVRTHSALRVLLDIWLNNSASFFLGASLIALSPALGLLSVVILSISTGQIVASWLAGYCSTAHLIYSIAEDQAYPILWALVTRLQALGYDLERRWKVSIREVKRILLYATATFFVLGIIEVIEVKMLG